LQSPAAVDGDEKGGIGMGLIGSNGLVGDGEIMVLKTGEGLEGD
jgi:hypothetical protein